MFINDKANARVAVIDLRDFETKQIVKNPNAIVDHGGSFVTPNTEYVIEGPQYATPIGWGYAPLSEYKEKYRGVITFWKFDREKGRIDRSAIVPDGTAALLAGSVRRGQSASAKAGSSAIRSTPKWRPARARMASGAPYEAGTTQNDTDYLHIINWKAAEAAFKAGKGKDINGISVIPLETAISDKLLFFTPEPKSPHGSDVTPGGEYIVVGGKLDPHVTIYSFDKIQKAIAAGPTGKDTFGVPGVETRRHDGSAGGVGAGPAAHGL